jgi:hypothetical protein
MNRHFETPHPLTDSTVDPLLTISSCPQRAATEGNKDDIAKPFSAEPGLRRLASVCARLAQ